MGMDWASQLVSYSLNITWLYLAIPALAGFMIIYNERCADLNADRGIQNGNECAGRESVSLILRIQLADS
jgi:hypothetical protein